MESEASEADRSLTVVATKDCFVLVESELNFCQNSVNCQMILIKCSLPQDIFYIDSTSATQVASFGLVFSMVRGIEHSDFGKKYSLVMTSC